MAKKLIRFGLTAIKGIGEDTVDLIIAERNRGGRFASLVDFAKRVPAKIVNKKSLEALAFSGALDEFGDRRAIVDSIEDLSRFARDFQEKASAGQMGLFGGVDEEGIEFALKKTVATKEDILRWERESLGLFVSDHPLRGLGGYFEKYGIPIGRISAENDAGKKRTIHGMVVACRRIVTRNGKNMAILEVEDTSGKIECAIFPKTFDSVDPRAFEEDAFLRIRGKIDERNDNLNLIVDEVRVGDLAKIREGAAEFSSENTCTPGGGTFSNSSSSDEDGGDANRICRGGGKNEEVFRISIPDGTTRGTVNSLKKILAEARAESGGCDVEVSLGGQVKKLSFRVARTGELERAVEKILGGGGELSF